MGKRERGHLEVFQRFLKEKAIKTYLFSDWEASVVEEKKKVFHIMMIGGLYLILLISLPLLYIVYSVQAITITELIFLLSFPFLPSIIALWKALLVYKRISVYERFERFSALKKSIFSERIKLELFINGDIRDSWIDNDKIWDIKKYILFILEWYKLISKSHKYVQNHMWYFWKISQEWQNIIRTELQWIVDYSKDLTLLIQSWISHHATELAELEKQIASQELSTQNSGWKAALEISRISLQEHLKELEKVKV